MTTIKNQAYANLREYWTKEFKKRLGELDYEDEEVLEDVIEFHIISYKLGRLF